MTTNIIEWIIEKTSLSGTSICACTKLSTWHDTHCWFLQIDTTSRNYLDKIRYDKIFSLTFYWNYSIFKFHNDAGNLYGFGCTTPSISFSAFPSTISSLLYITFEHSVWHSWSYLPPNLSVCLSLLHTWYHPSPPFTLCLSFILFFSPPIAHLPSKTSLPLSPTVYIPDRLNGTEMQHPMITLPAALTAQGQGQDLLLIPQGMIITLRWMREK